MDGPKNLAAWADLLKKLRRFFDERGFLEVQTDHVVPAGAFEGVIDTLAVSWSRGGHAELHTSPEIEMKRLLAKDRVSLYEICRCFRDDPETPIHRREFTMLEFYRVDADYHAVIADTKELLETLAGRKLPFETRSAKDIARAVKPAPGDTWEDAFFKKMVDEFEPSLPPEIPVVVMDYPASTSPLSKANPDGSAERFEIYWRGMELCNGCTELGDAAELRHRYESESAERKSRGRAPHPPPTRLLEAMDAGLPPCAGVAIGLERLFECLQLP